MALKERWKYPNRTEITKNICKVRILKWKALWLALEHVQKAK